MRFFHAVPLLVVVACSGSTTVTGTSSSGDPTPGGSSSGSSGGGVSIFDDAGGGDGGGGGTAEAISCDTTDPDFCACTANGGASNDSTSSPSTLSEPGACCAAPGWPSGGGVCTCAAFTCDVNAGGGRDCWYHAGDADHTTSATGAVCCLRLQGICSCYPADNADSCDGFTTVSSCTAAAVAPCTDIVDEGEVVVPTCR